MTFYSRVRRRGRPYATSVTLCIQNYHLQYMLGASQLRLGIVDKKACLIISWWLQNYDALMVDFSSIFLSFLVWLNAESKHKHFIIRQWRIQRSSLGATWRAREREPITGVWGRSRQRGPGAQPLVGVRQAWGETPWSWKAFFSMGGPKDGQICPIFGTFSARYIETFTYRTFYCPPTQCLISIKWSAKQ